MKFLLNTNNSLEITATADHNNKSLNIVFCFAGKYLNQGKIIVKNLVANPLDNLANTGALSLTPEDNSCLIVSLGDKMKFNLANYIITLKSVANFLTNKKVKLANLILEEELATILKWEFNFYIEQTIFHLINPIYCFDELKSDKKLLHLKQINCVYPKQFGSKFNPQLAIANAISLLEGMFLTKHLVNNPSNIVTPSYLAKTALKARQLSKKVSVEVLEEKDIKKLNMHTFLAVAKGSSEKAKFIKMEYKGAKSTKKPLVLIGKGITFDSGGLSIKPATNMEHMKFDMAGAATVIALFFTAVKLDLPINLVVLVPTCENMPSGNAVKPGDIVKTMSEQTVEIINTDAEGRLILCDILTYAKRYNPALVIDLATLTGAIIVALGHTISGLFSNDEELTQKLITTGQKVNDKVWPMPLFEEYAEALKSNFADMRNIGTPGVAGSVIAAVFLSKFVSYKWAHFDIAGTAFNYKDGATGQPFSLLIEFLRQNS